MIGVNMSTQDKITTLLKSYGDEVRGSSVPTQAQTTQVLSEADQKKIKEELIAASEKLNERMRSLNTEVSFKYNEDIKGLMVTVKEEGGDRVISEFPHKEAIALMKKMQDLVGILFDKQG